MTSELNNSSYLQKHPEICSREFDGETVMMNASLDKYFGLDEIATRIWQILEKKQSLTEIRDFLIQEYDVTPEQCLQDIKPFIEELIADQLVIVVDK